VAYELRGQFLESCDCFVVCPCWFEQNPDENKCTGVVAWYVEQGEIDNVDVSGLVAVSVSHHSGHRAKSKQRVALFIDSRADDDQQRVLERAFTGKAGGPLGELAQMTDKVSAVELADISFTSDGGDTKLTIGRQVTTGMEPVIGETERVTTVGDGALGVLLGTPAEVGKSNRFRLALDDAKLKIDVRERSSTRGRFAYTNGTRKAAGR
jgi:hypothetical protein